MAGLFSPESCARSQHLLEHVLITNSGSRQPHALALERLFQAQIRHYRSDDQVVRQPSGAAQLAGRDQQYGITVDDSAALRYENRSVGVTIESYTQVRFRLDHGVAQTVHVERAAAQID